MSEAPERTPAASPAPRFVIGFRLSLVLSLSAVVALTGGCIMAVSYLQSRETVGQLAQGLFRSASRQAVLETRALVRRAPPAEEQLEALLQGPLAQAELRVRGAQFLAALRANPDFDWVSYGDEQGEFLGAVRDDDDDDRLRLNHSAILAGRTTRDDYEVQSDGSWRVVQHLENTGYDPRARPWYRAARGRHGRAWTAPYVFFGNGLPGISCAMPHYGPEGALRGVLSIDFDLGHLSRFVRNIRLSEHSQVFLLAPDGTLVAHPSASLVQQLRAGHERHLVTVDELRDPLLQSYWRAAPRQLHDTGLDGVPFAFTHQGRRYLANYTEVDLDAGLRWIVGVAAPEEDFLGGVYRNLRFALAISTLAVALALFLSFLLGRWMAKPLVQLSAEMERVGNFELVPGHPTDTPIREITLMNRALESMKRGLRSFASFVPRDLVRAVLASGQESEPGGRTRELTLFFSDVAGFTTLAETMHPQDLVDFLAAYFTEMTALIGASHGTVDKFIGDGIMAFWNAPTEVELHAAQACQAALACQRKLSEMARSREEYHKLKTRIGLASGVVVVGNVGTAERLTYTAMGDVVNLAARLEGLNKYFDTRILASEPTVKQAGDVVVARPVDVVAVKGKAQGVKVYELLGLAKDEGAAALRELSARTAEALEAYLARDFALAVERYEAVLALRPGDSVATILRDRARRYLQHPPPEDWNGVYVATDK